VGFALLIWLRGYSPLRRCGVCIDNVVSQGYIRPPRGFFEFSAQRRYIFTAILYISQQTTPQRSVRPPHLRNSAGRRPTAHASSGLSIHGGGAGMSSSRRCRGSRPANQQRNLSQALQRALETFTQRNQSEEVSGVCFPRVLPTSPGLANVLNRRSPATAQDSLPAGIVPDVYWRPSPYPTQSGCRRKLPVGRTRLLSPNNLRFVLR
jgi:hypothetical protein